MPPQPPPNPPCFEPLEPRLLFAATPVGEAGLLTVSQPDAATWHDVTLLRSYANPVVVMNVVTENDPDPLTLRIQNITTNGFSFQLDEWDYLDGVHPAETVTYFVVEAGTHTLDDGSTLQAGFASVSDIAITVNLPTAMPAPPVLLTQVTSVNEASAVTTRTYSVTTTGFIATLQEEEPLKGPHATESVAWIAHTPAVGGSGERVFESARTGDTVTDAVTTPAFTQTFIGTPVVLADMQTADGGDTADIRLGNLNAAGFDVRVEEEQADNIEVAHTTEVIGYLAIDAGLLNIGPNTPPAVTNDAFAIDEDAVLTVTAANGVLSNDADGEGGPLTAALLAGPAHGSLGFNPDGSFTYTPDPDYAGPDSFTYESRDLENAATPATVNLTVNPINDAPVAAGDAFIIAEDTLLTGSVAGNDTDIDGGTPDFTLVTAPTRGFVLLKPDGTFRYISGLDAFGPDTWTYRIDDGRGGTDTATVTLTVEPRPDAPHKRTPLGPPAWSPLTIADPPPSPGDAEPTRLRLGQGIGFRAAASPIGYTADHSLISLPDTARLAETTPAEPEPAAKNPETVVATKTAEAVDTAEPTDPTNADDAVEPTNAIADRHHTPMPEQPLDAASTRPDDPAQKPVPPVPDEALADVQPEPGAFNLITTLLPLGLTHFLRRRKKQTHASRPR